MRWEEPRGGPGGQSERLEGLRERPEVRQGRLEEALGRPEGLPEWREGLFAARRRVQAGVQLGEQQAELREARPEEEEEEEVGERQEERWEGRESVREGV